MKPLKIVLNVPHMGKPHKPLDRGAVHEIYQGGSGVGIKLVEADLCLQYASIAHKVLTSLGHDVFLLTYNYYGQRAAFANSINADIYLDCHLNSAESPPRTNYALVEATELAGPLTRKFAQHMEDVFDDRLPVGKSKVKYIPKDKRGWSCINRVRAPALILEPVFINHKSSENLLTKNIWQISDAIVVAIKTFDWGT